MDFFFIHPVNLNKFYRLAFIYASSTIFLSIVFYLHPQQTASYKLSVKHEESGCVPDKRHKGLGYGLGTQNITTTFSLHAKYCSPTYATNLNKEQKWRGWVPNAINSIVLTAQTKPCMYISKVKQWCYSYGLKLCFVVYIKWYMYELV